MTSYFFIHIFLLTYLLTYLSGIYKAWSLFAASQVAFQPLRSCAASFQSGAPKRFASAVTLSSQRFRSLPGSLGLVGRFSRTCRNCHIFFKAELSISEILDQFLVVFLFFGKKEKKNEFFVNIGYNVTLCST